MDSEGPVVQVDFGSVPAGTVHRKTYKDPRGHQLKKVVLHVDCSVVDNPFTVAVDDNNACQLKMKFCGERPGSVHCAYYVVRKCTGRDYSLCLRACVKDLAVTVSRKVIELKTRERGESAKTCFTLENLSESTALYRFQSDDAREDIKIHPESGTLGPNKTCRIYVTFTATSFGVRYETVLCHVHHHPPLIIEVKAVCGKAVLDGLDRKIYFVDAVPEVKNSFQYLFALKNKAEFHCGTKPPVVLDRTYLDLGSKMPSSRDASPSSLFTATNLSSVKICLKWRTDAEGVFQVLPSSAVVERGGRLEFEATFRPGCKHRFYCRTLQADLCWGESFRFTVPFNVYLHIIGNSFEENSSGWLPDYDLACKVVLPPTVPNERVWTTLILRKSGRLPLMFRFLSDPRSLFRMEPEHGVIDEEFQIITVQFMPGLITGTFHRENKVVLLNTWFKVQLQLIGSVENPNVWFPDGDSVEFPALAPNCSVQSYLQLNNVTRHPLRLDLDCTTDEEIIMKTSSNSMLPGERLKLYFSFHPKNVGLFSRSRFLSVSVEDPSRGYKITNRHLVQFKGSVSPPMLTCIPEILHFGNVHKSETRSSSLVVTNIGECNCLVQLNVTATEMLSSFGSLSFRPDRFGLAPGQQETIETTVTGDSPGYQTFEISGDLCKTSSYEPCDKSRRLHLAYMAFYCYRYQFKIVDVICEGEEHIGKSMLWNMLHIDRWNDGLLKLADGSAEEKIYTKLPQKEISSKIFKAALIFKNISEQSCTLRVAKTTACSCPAYKTELTGLVLTRPDHLCPHRSQLHLTPLTQHFQPKEEKKMLLTVLYDDPTVETSTFRITSYISSNRACKSRLDVFIKRPVLASDEHLPDLCLVDDAESRCVYLLKDVFVGCPSPPLQAMWLYSDHDKQVSYKISMEQVDDRCLAPVRSAGVLSSRGLHPVFFKFTPLQTIKYQGKIRLSLNGGEKEKTVLVEGKGIIYDPKDPVPAPDNDMPSHSNWNRLLCDVSFLADHVTIGMDTHSKASRLVRLRNDSCGDVMFRWLPCRINDLVEFELSPSSGTVGPNRGVTFELMARSSATPFLLTSTVGCRLSYVDDETSFRKRSVTTGKSGSAIRRTKGHLIHRADSAAPSEEGSRDDLDCDISAYPTRLLNLTVAVNCTGRRQTPQIPPGYLKTEVASDSALLADREQAVNCDAEEPLMDSDLALTLSQVLRHTILDLLESSDVRSKTTARRPPVYYSDLATPRKRFLEPPNKTDILTLMRADLLDAIRVKMDALANAPS